MAIPYYTPCEPLKEAEGLKPLEPVCMVIPIWQERPERQNDEETAGKFLKQLLQDLNFVLSVTTGTMFEVDHPLVSGNSCERGNQPRKKIQEQFNDQSKHQKRQTTLPLPDVISYSSLNELVNVYANPWYNETTEEDFKSRNSMNLRRKQFFTKSRRPNNGKQSTVLKSYTGIIGYGRTAFRVPLHVANAVVLMIKVLFTLCWKYTNAKKLK